MSAEEDSASDDSSGSALRRLGRMGGWVVVGLLGLAILGIGLLQIDPVGTSAVRSVAPRFVPDSLELRVGSVSGSWLGSIRVVDLELSTRDGAPVLRIDTLFADYALTPLLDRAVHLEELRAIGVDARLVRHPAGGLGLRGTAPPVDPPPRSSAGSGPPWDVRIDHLQVADAEGRLRSPGDSTATGAVPTELAWSDVHLAASDVSLGTELGIRLDSLSGTLDVAGDSALAALGPLQARARGRLLDGTLGVDTVEVTGPEARLAGAGELAFPDTTSASDSLRFHLEGSGLPLAPLHVFLGNPADAEARLDAEVDFTGTSANPAASLELRTTAGGRVSGWLRSGDAPATAEGSGTRYSAELEMAALDPATFLGDTVWAGAVGGALELDLAGSGADRMTGHLDLRLDPVDLSGVPLRSARLESRWIEGEARLEMQALGDGLRAELSGTARPLDSVPAYDLSGPVEVVLPGVSGAGVSGAEDSGSGDSVGGGRVAGSLSLRGRGVDPATASTDAEMRLSTVEVGGARLDSAYLDAALDSGRVRMRLRARDPAGGLVRAEGRASVVPPLTFQVEEMVADGLDVAAMLGDSTSSRLDARLSARGRLDSTDDLELQVDGRADGRFGALQLDTALLELSLQDGRLGGSVQLRSVAGRLAMEVVGRPLDSLPTLQVERLAFDSLQLGAFTGDTTGAFSTRLSGTGQASVRGLEPASLEADAALSLDSSRIGDQSLGGGSATLAMSSGRIDLALDLTPVDSGGVRLDASAEPFQPRLQARIETLALERIDAGAWFPSVVPEWLGGLSATLSGSVSGQDPETMDGELTLRLDSTSVAGRTLRSGRLDARISAGELTADSRLDLVRGDAVLEASAVLRDSLPSYRVVARVQTDSAGSTTPEPALPVPPGAGRVVLEVEGRGLTPQTADARVQLRGDSVFFGEVRLDTLRLRGGLQDGVATLDTLHVRSNVVALAGGGTVGLVADGAGGRAADLRVEGDIQALTPLEGLVGMDPLRLGTGRVDLHLTGPVDSLSVEASATASALLLGTTELVGLDARIQARASGGEGLGAASGRIELDRLGIGGLDVRRSELDGEWDGDELTLQGDLTVDDRRDVSFQMAVDPRAQVARAVLDRLDVRVDDDSWSLAGRPSISWADGIQVDSLLLRAPEQAMLVTGRYDGEGGSDLRIELERLRIGGIADLAGVDRLDGTLSSALRLQGSAADPRFSLDLDAALRDDEGRRSTVLADLTYDSLRLRIDGDVDLEGGGRIRVEGGLPVDLALNPGAEGDTAALAGAAPGRADLHIQADSFQVAWAEPFLDPATIGGLEGRLQMDATVGGTQDSPALSGAARLEGGRLSFPALGTTWEGVGARVSLDGGVARLDSAVARSGDGEVQVSGTVALPELSLGEFDIEARLDRFQAMNNDAFHVRLSGTASMVGTTTDPRLEGDLELVETDVYLGDAISSGASVRPVELTPEEIAELEEYLGIPVRAPSMERPPLLDVLAMDLSVTASRDTWVRQRANPELEIQLSGDVRVTQEPGDSLRLDGRVETVANRSYLEQFGRRFAVQQGTLDFRGTIPRTQIEVEATYEVPSRNNPDAPEATITLDVSGTVDDLSLTLGSEPAMENADIVSYLATGRPASTGLSVGSDEGGGGLGSVGSSFALGQVTGLVEELAASGIGLDVVEIEADGLQGATLIAGRFVSPRVYVGFRQPVGRDARDSDGAENVDRTEVEIEYQALQWLLMNMEASQSTISFVLRFRRAY